MRLPATGSVRTWVKPHAMREPQANLLAELAELIERRGVEPFVAAPLLEADDRYFPDEWHANDASVARLARRLLDYAALTSYEVVVELAPEEDTSPSMAVWFAGVDGTTCRFSTALQRLDDPLLVVATIAHEVARAYRAIHQLDGAQEPADDLISLTTIYLGFGILTTNASYRYRAQGELVGSYAYTQWSHERFGGLPPEAMSFLLAAQLAARDATSSQFRAVVRQLEPNQRAYFEDAYGDLMPDAVAERLRLPPRASWPAPRPLPPQREGQLARSLLDAVRGRAAAVPTAAVVKGGQPRPNATRATFRIIGTAVATWTGLGLLVTVVLFCATAFVMSRFVSGPPLANFPYEVLVAMLVAPPVLGFVLGRFQRRDFCSDPECNAPLPQPATTCPGCGGTIAATLKSRNERLDAEDRLRLNRDEYDVDVDAVSSELAPGARPLFTPAGVAGGLIGADVHDHDEARGIERGTSSTVV